MIPGTASKHKFSWIDKPQSKKLLSALFPNVLSGDLSKSGELSSS